MDAPLVMSFLSTANFSMMMWWCIGFPSFVISMYTGWGAEAGALKIHVQTIGADDEHVITSVSVT
jgi:hypothetical protein